VAEIWQDAIELLRRTPHVSSFGSNTFDECVLLSVYAELYAIGERPSVQELRAYLEAKAPGAKFWNGALVDRWRRFTRRPETVFKALRNKEYPHRYPFLWVATLFEGDGLAAVGERLGPVAQEAVAGLVAAAGTQDDDALRRAEFELRRASRGLVVWSFVLREDRERFLWWGTALHPDRGIRVAKRGVLAEP
jgi:hypothetical protein